MIEFTEGQSGISITHHNDPFDHLEQEKFETKQLYKTIVIDFPWEISLTGKTTLRPNRRKELPYKTMTLDEIKKFPIQDFAQDGAHCYVWFTNKMMPVFSEVLEALGINFHLILPWVKPNGIAPCFAYKFATEFCILGFYGKPMHPFPRDHTGKPIVRLNWINAMSERDNHSTKPIEFYQRIKEMSPEPRIDIFARKRHDGFAAWGNQVEPLQQVLV